MEEIAKRVVEDCALELVDVELKRRRNGALVQVFVDRQGGIGLEDLQSVSRELSAVLDAEDPVEGTYTLEVSSPGLDRPLQDERDFRRAVGRLVRVATSEGSPRGLVGRVVAAESGVVRLALERDGGEERAIPMEQIESGRLEVEFK